MIIEKEVCGNGKALFAIAVLERGRREFD